MKKLSLLAAVAVGYVLGTRAGRARYEQIKHQAEKVWNTDPVQSTVDKAQEAAKHAASDVGHRVAETAKDVSSVVTEKVKTAADFTQDDNTKVAPAESDADVANIFRTSAQDLSAEADSIATAADAEAAFGENEEAADDLASAANVMASEAEDLDDVADALNARADAEAAFGGDVADDDRA